MVSYVGYEENVVTLCGRTNVQVQLQLATLRGQELVVVGYGRQQVQDLTGSISTVQAEDLDAVATNSINNMLQGKALGLDLRVRSAQPSGGATASLRGAISLAGNNW